MSWFNNFSPPSWSEFLKHQFCSFLLNRHLEEYVEDGLSQDQLKLNILGGHLDIININLDAQTCNTTAETYNLPVELISGFIEKITISIPWTALFKESCYIEVTGLRLTLQPKQRSEMNSSMFQSVLSSMTSSIVKEYLEDVKKTTNSQSVEGVEIFARSIESILNRVKIRLVDTVIRLEHIPANSATGLAMEIWIKNFEYSDEAGSEPSNIDPHDLNDEYVMSAFVTKRIYLEGVTFHIDEFLSRTRALPTNIVNISRESTPDSKNSSDGQYSSAQISPTNRVSTPPEKNASGNLNSSNPIIFAKLSGRQEIRYKYKQSDNVLGPKKEILVSLGTFTSFLSPRQVHVLSELIRGLAWPNSEYENNIRSRPTCVEKPMAKMDFNRVENELLNQMKSTKGLRSMDLRNTQGWSTASVDDSDNEDEFLPMSAPGATSMNNSVTSNNSSMEGSFSGSSISLKSSVTNIPRQHKHRHSIDTDPSAETMQLHIQVASIALLLLHDDILATGIEGYGLTKTSVKVMKSTAENFFENLGFFVTSGFGNKDFEKVSKLFENACQQSHLRLLASPLVVESSEKINSHHSSMSGNLTLARLEIIECLIDRCTPDNQGSPTTTIIELLTFHKDNPTNTPYSNKTDFEMRFNYSNKAVRHGQKTKFAHPRTEFNIILGPCQAEFDITIIDRISALLNPQPVFSTSSAYGLARGNINQQTLFDQAVESPSLPDSRTDIHISSTKCDLKIRFPIPDLRPVHDMNRVPWWKRSVRQDYVTLHLTDAKVHTCLESRTSYSARHEIQCRNLLLTYTKADSNLPVEIGKASSDECHNESSSQNEAEGFNWPRIVITVYPQHFEAPLEDSSEGEQESGDSLENTPKHRPSPFSSKKVIHESDIRQNPKSQTQNETKDEAENREGEELIIPGNRQEMTEFIEEGTRNSRIQIEIGLPCASVQIPSKYLYELIYNRFNTDLLLWESSAPRPKCMTHAEANIGLDFSTLLQESLQPKFSMCKSGIQYDSDLDSDDEGIFYPASEKTNSKQKQNFNSKNGQSKIAVTLNINHGLLTMHTPVRDSMQKVIPGQQGEIMLRVKDAVVFSVSKYKGDDNLGYICSMIKDVTVYHCGLVTTSSQNPPLKSTNSIIPKHCLRSIYRTESGANTCMNFIEKDMLSVAVKIQAADDTRRIKTFKVAVGISNATLRHRVSSASGSWFTQLKDCLDVPDYPIPGYNPPGVLTELYCHLWDCAIDYRPLHLPLRSVVTIGSFSISSNIAAQTNTLTLRFIAEDMALFLSNKIGRVVNLRQDYVSVIDLGLFEVSLRLNEKMCGGAPRVELRASNNVFHIRTCSDSCRALMQLLTYFAYDGDLTPNTGSTESIAVPSSEDGESLLEDESINMLSKRQIERVNSLMEDAMEEPSDEMTYDEKKKTSERDNQNQTTKVFYFPGELNTAVMNDAMKNSNAPSTNNFTKVDQQEDYNDDGDEDFCILGEEAGVGIVPRTGVPEIRWLGEEIVRIVDNHFSVPLGKTDVLKAPKSFPPAIFKYTLCEMTLIWHMYGGKDFENSQPAAKKHITINENSNNYGRSRSAIEGVGGVGYSKSSPNKVNFGSAPNSPRTRSRETTSWQIMGGPGRRHDILMELQLNKIRFQHEIYPEDTKIASRQVFVVSEFEIRDRLSCSQINKFLYLYSSNARPRRSHAHMFTVKANYVRPDQKLAAQECSLKVSLLPLRLNIDQDSLLFLINFFTELCGGSNDNQEISTIPNHMQSSPGSKQSTPTHQRPVMSVNENDDMRNSINKNEDVDRNLMTLLEDELTIKEKKSNAKIVNETQESGQPIYFRSVVFSSEGFVKLDYHSKRVLLSHGTVAALLMSIGDLQNIELRLKRLTNRHGILGFDKLLRFIIQEWTDDIKSQVPSILGGIGPLHSILKLYEGIRDLIWLPIEQYQKDGRIVRGLQRGTYNFSSSTMHALLVLTERLVSVIHTGAATAFDLVNPGPSMRCNKTKGTKGKRKRFNHPLDIREGMNNACQLVKEGFGDTYCQLVRVASEEHEQKGVSGAVGGVLRQLAPSVVAPIIICSEATHNVLGGMVSQLVPDARYEATQKWKKDDDFHEINY